MQSIDNITLEKHLKRFSIINNIISIVLALTTALSVGYGFYYSTTNTLSSHTQEIVDIKKNVESLTEAVNSSAIYQGSNKEQVKAIQEQVNDIKKSQDRIEDKLDRLILKTVK
jgi:septation ring formation regulator EzrA